MRIEGKLKNGKPTGATIRKENYKNQEVIGKKGIQKLKDKGKKGVLKKNFHSRIGGNKGKLEKEEIYMEAHDHIDDQLMEAEMEAQKINEKSDKTFRADKMKKEEKDTLKFVKKVLGK